MLAGGSSPRWVLPAAARCSVRPAGALSSRNTFCPPVETHGHHRKQTAQSPFHHGPVPLRRGARLHHSRSSIRPQTRGERLLICFIGIGILLSSVFCCRYMLGNRLQDLIFTYVRTMLPEEKNRRNGNVWICSYCNFSPLYIG